MLFMPYRVDLELTRTPFITVLICIVCLVIFQLQTSNANKIDLATYVFCQAED